MIRRCLGCVAVALLTVQVGAAQETGSSRTTLNRTTTARPAAASTAQRPATTGQRPAAVTPATRPAATAQRPAMIFNEASPSDYLATDGIATQRRSTGTAGTGRITPNLPISANMNFDDEERLEQYQREYEGRRWSMMRAQQERAARQLRMETRKFYGISLSRPMGSPMMMGGVYAPNWIGGWNTAYGLPGQYPTQYLNYQYR